MKYTYDILGVETIYSGFHKIELFDFTYNKFDGTKSKITQRELSRRKSCVGVLPYDPILDRVILIEQIRLGPLANNEHPWMLEIVAGIVEDNEGIESTALREAKEEANCIVDKLIPIYEYYSTPGGCSEKINLYIGITDLQNAGGIHGVESEGEDIKAHVFTADEAFNLLKSGKINNASTIIALQWLANNINTHPF